MTVLRRGAAAGGGGGGGDAAGVSSPPGPGTVRDGIAAEDSVFKR